MTRPQRGGATEDGRIEPYFHTDGPVLVLFGPFAETPGAILDEYRLRGTKESMTAPTHEITLRGHPVRDDGYADPAELPLGPGRQVLIVCGCGHRHSVSLSTLSEQAEVVRAALDQS